MKPTKSKKKLWQTNSDLNKLVEIYTSGDDVLLDQNLVEYDIYGSLAHASMLHKQDLIGGQDLKDIKTGLLAILDSYQKGNLILEMGDEDVHTRVENELTQKYPEAGARLHTGRSRNDQVLVDIRLYTKDQLLNIASQVVNLAENYFKKAEELSDVPMPGMTHMQPAMLSSFGLWLGAFAESLLDDLSLIEAAFNLNDQSPLGSGAAYGVTLPIDREHTAQLLGFSKVQNNPLYCQNSRGKVESAVLHALAQVMATLNKFATDCLVFTTEPFSFISFDKRLGTGSSIMPQKQNWDALELMRAKYHQLLAAQLQMSTSLANLPSGYNRDSQQVKETLMSAIKTTSLSLDVAGLFVDSLTVNKQQVEKHIPKELFATPWAYMLVEEKGMPFRQAYMYVKEHLSEIPDFDKSKLLKQAVSQGSTGNLNLSGLETYIKERRRRWEKARSTYINTVNKLKENKNHEGNNKLSQNSIPRSQRRRKD